MSSRKHGHRQAQTRDQRNFSPNQGRILPRLGFQQKNPEAEEQEEETRRESHQAKEKEISVISRFMKECGNHEFE